MIVVPKKSAPDEPPRRRLCVDYRKVNSLQQEVKRADKGTGCLSLYPLPKIDEMFAKLKGARFFSTIDLGRSGYYHIGLTRESRAKSAFVVPMGKWEFKRTPFGLSQAPAYFQLLIDKVLMGCSKFAMGYLDDIIIFSNNKLEHLQHIEEIFKRLERFGLKMKREKCDFFKKHIQYLGHFITEEGFTSLPEKLESIRKMPRPKTPKEVKQFLGLIGYYRKFVPRFSDIARSLTNLTRQDVDFKWTEKCDKAFMHLKELLMEHPILRYPDPERGYTLFTDASGIGWAGVLTQEFTDDKGKKKHHPISYVSGQFRGSQQNWAALTKEAYAIYMSVRKHSFYITDAEVTIKCDHLPLKKFLQKQTLNAKVNNWAVELEQFNLKLEWIQGAKNTLADSLSRLLEVDPEAKLHLEREGHEFGTFCFEELNETGEILPNCWTPMTDVIEHIEMTYDEENVREVNLPLKTEQMIQLQKKDTEARNIVNKLHKEKESAKMFILHKGVLCRLWTEERETFRCTFIPEVLRDPLLVLAHNQNGHNGGRRTYMALKRLYYWPGMRGQVFKHCKNCQECILQNQANISGDFKHFKMLEIPMQLICMDLVGPISPVTTRGNRFILTCIDMPTGFTVAIPRIKNVCDQAGRSLRQELMNKSEPVVQNFIRTMGDTWTDEDVIDEILKYFSDIPTLAHAITKLRTLIQGDEEAIVTYNQKYRTLVERVEGRPVEKIDSYVKLEQYLGSIILPIRKSIRNNIYWKSKHAPKMLGEAMKKAEELYMKHIYATGEIPTQKENTRGEISRNKPQENKLQSTFEDKEGFETDFLISPGDVYPNRKVKLQDAEITNETRRRFEEMCDKHPEAFSKNNKDIGRTTLIEMEIDTGDSLPVTQNPYTLPLKHHEWV